MCQGRLKICTGIWEQCKCRVSRTFNRGIHSFKRYYEDINCSIPFLLFPGWNTTEAQRVAAGHKINNAHMGFTSLHELSLNQVHLPAAHGR